MPGDARRDGGAESSSPGIGGYADATTGKLIGKPIVHGDVVTGLAFTPDGTGLVTTSLTGRPASGTLLPRRSFLINKRSKRSL
jgi:hypothetical protein